MAATARTEAHEVAHRSGLPCPACHQWQMVETDVAFVASDTLEILARYTGSECACGFEEVTR